jgi:thiol-disulfide isomerase/thioredoxin
MKIIKTLALSIVLLISANVFAQETVVANTYAEGTNMVNLNDAKYAGMSFENIISEYEGKVIYLDFWASWCRPCKNEMPHSLNMQKHFKGKDVVFLYLSSDRDQKAWEKAVAQLKITGENYLVTGKIHNEYNTLFDVKYIPRYVLINKDGEVVNATANRPSNPQSTKDIEALL